MENIKLKGKLEIFEKTNKEDWKKIKEKNNIITTVGFNVIANRLTGQGSYNSTTFEYFAWSDGTVTPNKTRTASQFYLDGANNDTKGVQSYETFDTANQKQVWNCFLSSTDNDVSSITKFALMNDDPGTIMFNEIKFDAISKDNTKELFFRYSLTIE